MNLVREQLRSMLQTHPRDGGFAATFTLSPDLAILPDHFPGQPILPGMCMVQAVLIAATASCGGAALRIRRLKNAKLMAPVQPGDVVQIDATVSPVEEGAFAIKAKLTRSEQKVAEISVIAVAAAAELLPQMGHG